MKIERILAGVDLGSDTGRVLAYAALFAKEMGASLDLLSVIDYLVTPPTYLVPYIEEEKRTVEGKFRFWSKELQDYGITIKTEVMVGRLNESFEAAIKKGKADMLVLGFRSHTLRRSSSERLIKGIALPMLVVKGRKSESAGIGAVRIRKVLCAVDFSEMSEKALNMAKALGDLFSAEVEAIHVLPSHVLEKRVKTESARERARKELLDHAEGRLNALLREAGIENTGVIEEGDPYRRIVSFSEESESDLIVLGAKGLSFIRGVLIGSVTDAVLKSSPCPVLVAH
ncbi:MAG TPA: universal stress protein [Thermodesulfovibrionales bacterium]|nr:universal stress protein [Thermodesulfovibrionales bacterium]